MTNEEAILRIKDHMLVHKMNEPRAIYISQALELAIEALKETERNPTISSWYDFDRGYNIAKREYCSKWIPVSERLPEESGAYLISFLYNDQTITAISSYSEEGRWNLGDVDVVAWMPLPEPYEKGSEEDDN